MSFCGTFEETQPVEGLLVSTDTKPSWVPIALDDGSGSARSVASDLERGNGQGVAWISIGQGHVRGQTRLTWLADGAEPRSNR